MFLVDRSLKDPFFQEVFFSSGKLLVGVGGRHDLVWILRKNPDPCLTVVEIAGYDSLCAITLSESTFMGVESQFCLSGVGIRAVTGKTFISEDRPDIPGKIGRAKGGPGEKNRARELGDDGSAHP